MFKCVRIHFFKTLLFREITSLLSHGLILEYVLRAFPEFLKIQLFSQLLSYSDFVSIILIFESTNHKLKITILGCDNYLSLRKVCQNRDFSKQTIFIWENTAQQKSILLHISRSVFPFFCEMFPANFSTLVCYFDYNQIMMSKIEFQIHLR